MLVQKMGIRWRWSRLKCEVFCSIVLWGLTGGGNVTAEPYENAKILQSADAILSPQPFKGQMEMTVHKSDGRTRIYRMTIFCKSKDKVIITFQYPEIEKGRKVLSLGDDMWMYMPSVKRTIRVSPKQKFLDGDFTNGDVCRLDFNQDYTVKNKHEEEGHFKLQLIAKDLTVAYSRVVYQIQKDTFIPQSQEFYTLSGKLIKTLLMEEVRQYGNDLRRPSRFFMKNNIINNKHTLLVYKHLEHNIDIPEFYYYKDNLNEF